MDAWPGRLPMQNGRQSAEYKCGAGKWHAEPERCLCRRERTLPWRPRWPNRRGKKPARGLGSDPRSHDIAAASTRLCPAWPRRSSEVGQQTPALLLAGHAGPGPSAALAQDHLGTGLGAAVDCRKHPRVMLAPYRLVPDRFCIGTICNHPRPVLTQSGVEDTQVFWPPNTDDAPQVKAARES